MFCQAKSLTNRPISWHRILITPPEDPLEERREASRLPDAEEDRRDAGDRSAESGSDPPDRALERLRRLLKLSLLRISGSQKPVAQILQSRVR
jgi:hypothetical protein